MVILPNENIGLAALEKSIFQQEWKSILGSDLFSYSDVNVTIPKFKIECSFTLKTQLQHLGIKEAFTDEADFSLMTGNRDLKIDDVIHKAFFDVRLETLGFYNYNFLLCS